MSEPFAEDFDPGSPEEFFERDRQLNLSIAKEQVEERLASKSYQEFAHAAAKVFGSRYGKRFLDGLMTMTGYRSTAFRVDDGGNTHLAAVRDGQRHCILHILHAVRIGKENLTKGDPDEIN